MCAMFKNIPNSIRLTDLETIKNNCDNLVNTYNPDDTNRKEETTNNPIFDHINDNLYTIEDLNVNINNNISSC